MPDGAHPRFSPRDARFLVPVNTPTDSGSPPRDLPPSEIVLQAELIEVSQPTDPWLAARVTGSPFPPPGSTLQLYVARARDPDGLEAGLVSDLRPGIFSYAGYHYELVPGSLAGSYEWRDKQGLAFDYLEGTDLRFESDEVGPWDGDAAVFQPSSARVDVPEFLAFGSDLTLDYGNQGFTSNVAIVLDEAGIVTWSNEPHSIDSMYASNKVEVSSVTIPAEAFPTAGDYAVGLAGCTRTTSADLTALDPALTAVRAGRIAYWRVSVE